MYMMATTVAVFMTPNRRILYIHRPSVARRRRFEIEYDAEPRPTHPNRIDGIRSPKM